MNNKYLADRKKWLLSGSYVQYEKMCKRYDIPQAPCTIVYDIMLHKCRYNSKDMPLEVREESQKWLLDRGYDLEI